MNTGIKYIDISLPIHEGMAVYPDTPGFSVKPLKTKTSFSSELTLGSHIGTHIDAPRHVFEDGVGVDQLPLARLTGPCRVLDLTHVLTSIGIEDLKSHNIQPDERILFKTRNSQRGFEQFYEDYVHLSGDAADELARIGVGLVGIDALSIKQKGSPDIRAHTSLLKNNIVIIEGLDLSKVEPGDYNLICLPLRLVGLDGSPTRAVLYK